jgi:hypothetical protein
VIAQVERACLNPSLPSGPHHRAPELIEIIQCRRG